MEYIVRNTDARFEGIEVIIPVLDDMTWRVEFKTLTLKSKLDNCEM